MIVSRRKLPAFICRGSSLPSNLSTNSNLASLSPVNIPSTRCHFAPSERKCDKLLQALRSKEVTCDFALETIEAWVNPGSSAESVSGSLSDAKIAFKQILRDEDIWTEAKTIDRLGITYSHLMHSLLKTDNDSTDFVDRLRSASELRNGMEGILKLQNNQQKIHLSTAALSAEILFHCKSGDLQKAQRIVAFMMERESLGDKRMAPDLICFNIMIYGWANVGAVEEATNLIHLMISRNKSGKSNATPDLFSMNGVLQAYANSNKSNAAVEAEKFLAGMQVSLQLTPNTYCYNTLIDIYAKSRSSDSAKRAERILRHMMLLEEQGHDVQTTVESFTAVIDALSKSDEPDALEKAGQLVHRMEELATAGNNRLAPTVVTYNSFINVLAKSKSKIAGRTALGVLHRMKDRFGIEPSAISFNSVISALVHSGVDESDTVLSLISEMKGSTNCKPTTITYNAVLHVLGQSQRQDAIQIAQTLIHEMQLDNRSSPSTITYNTIMNMYAKRSFPDSAERIEEILIFLENHEGLFPNKQSYTTAISAWARSHSTNKVQRASSILERMKKAYESGNQTCEPDVVVYNALLNCCCFSMGQCDEATRVAMNTFSHLQESGGLSCDSITYSCTLQALGRNMQAGDRKDMWLKRVFDHACKDGWVSHRVWEQLSMASPTLFQRVIAECGGQMRCPTAWSRRANLKRHVPR